MIPMLILFVVIVIALFIIILIAPDERPAREIHVDWAVPGKDQTVTVEIDIVSIKKDWGTGYADGLSDGEAGRPHQVCHRNDSMADKAYWAGYSAGWIEVYNNQKRKS